MRGLRSEGIVIGFAAFDPFDQEDYSCDQCQSQKQDKKCQGNQAPRTNNRSHIRGHLLQ